MSRARTYSLFLACAVLTVALSGSPARAQACPAGPFPGVAPIAGNLVTIFPNGFGALGDNLIEIPAFSPVNDTPLDPLANGFQDLCAIFGLVGTASEISQINAATGAITSFWCDQIAAPAFQPCQGVLIRPDIAAPVVALIPGGPVEGTWLYPYYADGFGPVGDSIFGIPVTWMGGAGFTAEDLCLDLGLPVGTSVISIDAALGIINSHICGNFPIGVLTPGNGVLIRPPAAGVGAVPIF